MKTDGEAPLRTWQSSFWALIATQFQGAFSDNAYKFMLIFVFTASSLSLADRDRLIFMVAALFSIPFILFSLPGGYLADRYSKRTVTIGTKFLEIAVMLIAVAGFAINSLPLQLVAVFLLSTQAAFFGPSKYGLLPELLPQQRLSWGNGVIELGTFLAIIAGTLAGGMLAAAFRGAQVWSGLILLALAVVGLVTSLGIGRVPAAAPTKQLSNFRADLLLQLRLMRRDRTLLLAILGNTYIWLLAALLQLNIVFYGTDVLHLTESENGILQASLAIGIGLGSLLAGYLSQNKIEYGLVPLGSIGITLFGILLYRPNLSLTAVAVNLGLLGIFGGFFVVPVNALIQHRPDPEQKGGIIAWANQLSFVGIFLASGLYYLMASVLKLTPPAIFLCGAGMTVAATLYILVILPDAFLRLLLWLLTHSIYRIRIEGRDHIPAKGGALLVCNHLSFIDAMLLMASTDRRVRFIMLKDFYEHPLIHPFARIMEAIPISSKLRPRDLIHSLREASAAIQGGRVVCIFAEGQITRIGQLLPFRRGLERIMKGVEAPIIPVNLDGVWGSIFSFDRGRFLWKRPRRSHHPVTVSYGRPLPPAASAFDVRQAVQELHTEAYRNHKAGMKPLHRTFIRAARHHPLWFSMADGRVPKMRAAAALMRAIFLGRRLKQAWRGPKMVGILLPPSVAGSLVNYAALLAGKVPVNLNYTASNQVLAACARQCEIRTVVTSRAFLEKVNLEVPGERILLEDLAAGARLGEQLLAFFMAWVFPIRMLEKALGAEASPTLEDLATVIFSSGSTGDPKGVMLTHYNIASNVEQLGQVFSLGKKDRILGVLPLFHSFGFTGTFALPLALGAGVIYHTSPLDAAAIGELVRKYAVTFLLATPTFLMGYLRRCDPEDFGSLDYALVGAEKLHERVAQAFEDRFGLRPLEAYGCTECSPAVAVNARDYRGPGYRQVGAKRGKIGHPLPGVSVRIVDPETMNPLGVNKPGLLLVRGPNVMKGYLSRPETTAAVLCDGWYVTGDIAAIDEDGFLAITDRLSRFSKIGGEMIPHLKIEEKLQEIAGVTEQIFAVTGVPDEKKGERLVVLHTLPADRLKECIGRMNQTGLPNLWVPRPDSYFHIHALPYLGSGKLDLRRIRELARECVSQPAATDSTQVQHESPESS
jgi:acyl-[acyl-carrier-protein]-phospholipid O-acyltransferase / long-chain-fatty-acid--[acyl-carrier-protein] ligase